MNKTVCIVGTHPTTRGDAPWYDTSKDIWVFNNQILQGWCPRADICFDIHPTEDIHRRGLEHPQFGQWLKVEKGMKFMTPFPVPDCPNNEIYPLEQIVEKLLPNFVRGTEPIQYFTSGPAYALAYAIYLGYERIEMYGIEMESDSEYVYQRDGVALWHGIAVGRGIQVVIQEKSTMYYAPRYGIDVQATTVDREAFVVRASELEIAMQATLANVNARKAVLDQLTAEINEAKQKGATDEEMMKFAKPFEQATNEYEQAVANHAFVNGQYIDCKAWAVRIDKAMEYSGRSGEVLALRGEKWHRFQDRAEKLGTYQQPEQVVRMQEPTP